MGKTIEERAEQFFQAVSKLATEMRLEVEFTTQSTGGWMAYDRPVTEFIATDTHDYLMVEGGKVFRG